MAKVEIAEPAKADIQEAFDWWSENRSAIQAAEWYERIFEAITTLESMPERCPRVSESGLSQPDDVVGLGSLPFHQLQFRLDPVR